MKKTIHSLIVILIFTISIFANETISLTKEEKEFLEKNTPLRLHNELNWPPYNYFENYKPKGFSIDYMSLLLKKLNAEANYVTGPSWDEFMQMLQDDEIDAIINISKNEERAKTIAFTSIFHTAANAIYVKNGNEHLDSLEKLEGKTIVMPKGFFAQKAIAKYYPNIKQILVKDSLEALKILSLGKADATIGKKNVIDYVITLNNLSGVSPTNFVDDNRMVSLIRIGTTKKKKILRDIFEKAQKSVTDAEILELKRKWFGTKDILASSSKNFLTTEENSYIEKQKVFKMCNQVDIKPIEFEENGMFQGITIDLLDKISRITNAQFVPVSTSSWEEAKSYLKQNKCDFISAVTNSGDIIDFANTTNTYLNYKLAIITQKNKPVVSSLDNVLNKTIAKKEDSKLIPLLQSTNPDLNILYTKSNRESLEAVSLGKAYFALEPLPIATYYMSNYGLKNLYISRYTNMPYTVNMAVHKDNKTLLNILNKSLNSLSQTEHREIFNRWTSTSYETVFDYAYFWEILAVLIIFISVFSYRHYVLDKLNKNLKIANDEIEKKTQELAKQKFLFERLYSKSADGVILIKDNIFINCNEAICKILKYKESDIINKNFLDISPIKQPNGELSQEKAHIQILKALKEGVTNFEWVFKDAEANTIWVEIVLTSIEIENNTVLHTVVRDISNRKILEQKLEDLNVNLEKKVQEEIKKNEINTQQLVQQSRLAQMGEMISMIAHQWRQPLSAISATTNNLIIKMMLEEKMDKKLFDNELKLISEYSQYLSSTIDDFRNFFKTDKAKIEFDLKKIIDKSLYIIKTSLEANTIVLTKDIKKDIKIYSYPSELQQVILNILKNAEDALIEKNILNKKIHIETSLNNDSIATIKISDNAGGIDKNIIEKVFDPYFSTKNQKNGTGLGLYMSKIIVNEHCNGNLKVLNEKDGATFIIEIPIKNS